MFPSDNDDLQNKFLKILLNKTTNWKDSNSLHTRPHNHNLMVYLYQPWRQKLPLMQLRGKFETVSICFYIEVKPESYDLAAALGS